MNGSTGYSRMAIVAALVAFGAFALAAVLFISGEAAAERLGLLFGLFGTIVVALIGALRADAAAKSTDVASSIGTALNGSFDARVRNANRVTSAEPADAPLEPIAAPHEDANAPDPNAPAAA